MLILTSFFPNYFMKVNVRKVGESDFQPQFDIALMEKKPETAKILFGSRGWPSGMLEIASYVKSQKTGEPTILDMEPPEKAIINSLALKGEVRE